jgi:hypothetical protein
VECGSQCSFGERHSMTEEILTGVTTRHRRKMKKERWEEKKGKKMQQKINKYIILT